jgi:hypothetical protein
LTSHLNDLLDDDMQIIYGAYRAGIRSYGNLSIYRSQEHPMPNGSGVQIHDYLILYRERTCREGQ